MYKIKNTSITNLTNNGFKPICLDGFCLHFPIYWHNKRPLIFCNAIIYPEESKQISLEVVRSDGSIHYQWFHKNYKQAGKLLHKFDTEIDKRMKKIGAKFYEDR